MGSDLLRQLSEGLPSVPRVVPLAESLVALGDRQAEADRQVRRDLKSVADFVAYRDQVRRNFWDALGGMPDRTPLNPRVAGHLQRDGYRVEKVIFESRPRFFVTAVVYLPTVGQPPYPAVLRPLGHFPHGKATYFRGGHDVQGHAIALARKGYVVLTFDPYGQLERGSYFDARSGNNHFVQGTQGLLTGMHVGQHYVWDSIRAMDYLISRPEVDPRRVCVTGTSGGGSQTVYHAALDDRVAVSIPVCYVVESHRQIGDLGLHPESVFPGYVRPYGPNNTALVACVAPRPQLIIGARDDPAFPPRSMAAVYEEVRSVYRLFDAEDRLALVLTDSQHGYTTPMRQAMYRWVGHWFGLGHDDQEPSPVLEVPEDLFCTSSGDVAELRGETVFSLNRAYANELAERRAHRREEGLRDGAAYREAVRAGLVKSLLLEIHPTPLLPATIDRAATALDESVTIRFEPEPGFHVVLYLSVPTGDGGPWPVVVHCNEEINLPRPALLAGLLRAGLAVATVDARLGPAYAALTFGRTDVGMAVADLVRAVDLLNTRPEVDRRRIAVYGEGEKQGLAALMAGVVDDRFAAIAASRFPCSLAALLDEPDRRSDLHLLPGALRYYDVADVSAALAPRPQLLIHPNAAADWPRRFYAAAGSARSLRVAWCQAEELVSHLITWLKETLC